MGAASLNRFVRATLVAILVGALSSLGAIAPALAAARVPKVVLIVGPVGTLTSSYRTQADAAARVAAAAGAEVVKVYSPNATWPAVQRATEGASIVVYLGHGNGWPSRYRDSLYPPSQDGFGLNPVAGIDDNTHQYFGEASVSTLHFAADAVVVLSHLCYASGNTEPGLAEGTVDQAIARVDNYASGFLRAGARAVVAEGHMGPAYYVRALLTSRLSVEQIWARSPTAHGNAFSAASVRSPGYTELLDPDSPSGGYFRSLVSAGLDAAAVRAGARGTAGAMVVAPPAQPSLASLGLRFGTPSLRTLPIAGTTTRLTLPLARKAVASVPKGAQVGVRWDPILLDPQPAASPATGDAPDASGSPAAGASPAPSLAPASSPASPAATDSPAAATPGPGPSAAPDPGPSAAPDLTTLAPDVELVAPEQLGSVVTIAKATATSKGLVLDVTYPTAPGLYRLVTTLHTPLGVAYDAATQSLLTPVIVRVGGPYAAAYGVPAALTLTAGTPSDVAARVVNAGSEAWDTTVSAEVMRRSGLTEAQDLLRTIPARLVATWISVDGHAVPAAVQVALPDAASKPGGNVVTMLHLTPPADAGSYLLLLDVVSPTQGPLSALGSAPGLVRVTVLPAAAATPPQDVVAPGRPG